MDFEGRISQGADKKGDGERGEAAVTGPRPRPWWSVGGRPQSAQVLAGAASEVKGYWEDDLAHRGGREEDFEPRP